MPSYEQWLSWRWLERWQVIPLALSAGAGLVSGRLWPDIFVNTGMLIWALLALLLFTVFLNLDLRGWRRTLIDRHFLRAALIMNFVLLPLLTGLTLFWLPAEPAIQFAVLLVLLAPCTDWFLSFNLMGRGNPERATAMVPLLLLGQIVAIPLWMSLYLGPSKLPDFELQRFLAVFIGLFLLPLGLALFSRRMGRYVALLPPLVERLRLAPIFLLMAVIFLISATELSSLLGPRLAALSGLIPIFLLWALAALALAYLMGRVFDLAVPARRTLMFNAASRNSFVVLPFALALPVGAHLAAGVILLQALVELCLLIALTHVVPRLIR